MPPFINGLFYGLIFLFALGPAFFALIQTSIQQGFKRAVFLAIGVSLSDIIYVIIVLLGMAKMLQSEDVKFWAAIFGAVMLLGYALYSWFKKPKIIHDTGANGRNPFRNILKGMLLNGLNPFIIVIWATWVSTITVRYSYDYSERIQFFCGMLVMILCLDLLKAAISHRLKHLITVQFVRRMNQSVAIILVIFTFRIFYFLFENYM